MQSPERLRLLLILTVVDIRAVGPGVWNEWKRTLLRSLFEAAEERLRLGHKQHGRAELVEARQQELAGALGWKASAVTRACQAAARQLLARRAARLAARQRPPGRGGRGAYRRRHARMSSSRTIPKAARPGSASSRRTAKALFYRICAGLAAAGANIIDARIHTTRDGMALDNLLVLDGRGQRLCRSRGCATRLVKSVEAALDEPAPPPLPRSAAAAAERRLRGRAVGGDCRSRVDPNDRGRGQCARPARAARRAGRGDPRAGPPHPFGAYRDLWRARGRRLLSDRAPTGRNSTTTKSSGLRAALLDAARDPASARAA